MSMIHSIELSLIKVKVYLFHEVEVQIMKIRVQIIKMKSRLRALLPDLSSFNYTSLATTWRERIQFLAFLRYIEMQKKRFKEYYIYWMCVSNKNGFIAHNLFAFSASTSKIQLTYIP